MNDDIIVKINKFKNIQNEIDAIKKGIEINDIAKINDIWNDKNTDIFIQKLLLVNKSLDEFSKKIDNTIDILKLSTKNEGDGHEGIY